MGKRLIVMMMLLCNILCVTMFAVELWHQEVIAQKTKIIEDAISLPYVVAYMIACYEVTVSPRWIALLNDDYTCPDSNKTSFVLFEPHLSLLKINSFRAGSNDSMCNSLLSCGSKIKNEKSTIARTYGDAMVECLYKNSEKGDSSYNIEIAANTMSVGEQGFRESYGIELRIMRLLTYLMSCQVQLAAQDSDVYQRAQRRTTLMMRGDMTWRQLGLCMDQFYRKCKNFCAQENYTLDDSLMREYIQTYESSAVSRWLKKIDDCGDLQPILYKNARRRPQKAITAVPKRKRKRSQEES